MCEETIFAFPNQWILCNNDSKIKIISEKMMRAIWCYELALQFYCISKCNETVKEAVN